MNDFIKPGLKLLMITVVAGLALGFTNAITALPIEEQAIKSTVIARQNVLPGADEFVEISETNYTSLPEGLDNAFEGKCDGKTVGFTGQITVNGYGGSIEIIVGIGLDGAITGVNIGGSDFSETAGLGAKAKDKEFLDQFVGLIPEVKLNNDVDAITAATITSAAVTNGVNDICRYLSEIVKEVGEA